MQEWFYVKNDLVEREDIKGIIQCPIWSHFGIRRPSLALGNDIQACQAAYNTVCTYIGTRDLVQEHICHTRVSGHQDPGANIITGCAGTKSHTYDESWHKIECNIFTI
jgi:hypothetical protein